MNIDIILLLPIWRCSTINQQYNISHDLGRRVLVIFKYKISDYLLNFIQTSAEVLHEKL